MKSFFVVLKKELKRIFTDKRMLLGIVLPALLTLILYNFMGVGLKNLDGDNKPYVIYVENEPENEGFNDLLYNMFKATDSEITINLIENSEEREGAISLVESKKADLVIIYEDDFYNKLINYPNTKVAPKVEVYHNSIMIKSEKAFAIFQTFMNSIKSSIINEDVIVSKDNDLATEESIMMNFISQVVPIILICLLVSCAASFCTESIAGEKERGTIATMLVTPVKRESIIFGKLGALTITTLLSSFLSFAALFASIPNMLPIDVSAVNFYSFTEVSLILLVIILTSTVFTIMVLIASTLAKSTKEANSLTAPIIMIAMSIGLSAIFLTEEISPFFSLIPIFNSVVSFKGLLSLDYSMLGIGFTIITNIILIIGGVFVLRKMFNSEKIMFSE